MITIGVDPGQTTGVAWYSTEHREITVTAQSPAYGAVLNLWDWLERLVLEERHVEVAVERYVIGPRTLRASRQYDALHVAGSVRFKCQQLAISYTEYPASEAKRLVTDERLQRLGCYHAGKVHVNDATRQALTHLARTRPDEFKQLLDAHDAWPSESDGVG